MLKLLMVICGAFSFAATSPQTAREMAVTLELEERKIPEHLPIPFDAIIKNGTSEEVELVPFDQVRSNSALDIKFKSPLLLTREVPDFVNGSSEVIRIPPFASVTLKGYLQDYFQHLKPAKYQVPYSLRWTYYRKNGGPIEPKLVEAQGQFQFEVESPDSGRLKEYLSQRVAIVNRLSDLTARDRAALEITRIDDPAVLPYLKVLKGIGYESEVLDSSQRLPDPAATEILASVAVSSKDIGNVKYALKAIEDRGAQVPVDTVRPLLNSKDKWVQIAGLEYVERSGRREFQEDVNALVRHADRDVSAAALKAKNKLEGIPPQ